MSRLPAMDSIYRFYKGRQVTRCVMAAVLMVALIAASYSPPPRSVNPAQRRGELRVVTLEGPATYTKERGGYEHMLARHHDLGITPEQRLAFVTLLSRAADDVGLPADPEFRAAIMGYAEWGSRLALHNSQPGAQTAPHAPVPHWGWGVAPPYQPGS